MPSWQSLALCVRRRPSPLWVAEHAPPGQSQSARFGACPAEQDLTEKASPTTSWFTAAELLASIT